MASFVILQFTLCLEANEALAKVTDMLQLPSIHISLVPDQPQATTSCITWPSSHVTVSYTHLTLPTTPYV